MADKAILCVCYLLAIFLNASALGPGRTRGLKPPPLPSDTPLPEAKWISQKLDHFAKEGTTYWKQRYFVNATWWDGNGPVFLLLGGEGPANPTWLVADTNIMVMAKKYGALVFSVEHRFYGESHPTEDVSLSSLKYLSSRQALADFSYFSTLMWGQYHLSSSNKVVVFGGSYSGALAAWFRQLYPDVAIGAVATSAPVMAKVDFLEYVEVTAASLGTSSYGELCPASILAAFSSISDMLVDKTKWSSVEKMFNIRPPLKTSMDVANLMETLAGVFEGVVQYNRDNKAFEGSANNITIEYLCSFMGNTSLGPPLERFLQLYNSQMKGAPLNVDYDGMIKSMSADQWNSSTVEAGERQWIYQTCTEFAYFQTTSSIRTHIFSELITLDYYMDICQQVYGLTSDDVKAAVNATNNFYGGRNVTGTNIVFPNGSIDQWHALSVTSDLSDSVKAVFIEGTAHCANMYPPSTDDVEDLVMARTEVSMTVGLWVMAPNDS